MTDTKNVFDETRDALTRRRAELAPLIEEAEKIDEVLASFNGGTKAGRKRATSSSARGRRAKRGSRPEQFVKLVAQRPGIRVAEAAEDTGISQNYLYRLAADLVEAGKLSKQGLGYFPVSADGDGDTEPAQSEREPVAA